MSKKAITTAATLFAAIVTQSMPVNAQQNPFIGTWSIPVATPQGLNEGFLDFNEDGSLHLSGVQGQVFHLYGRYQFDPGQQTLSYSFQTQCGPNPGCYPAPPPYNQRIVVSYQFLNPSVATFSDGGRIVRQPRNPYPPPQQ